MNETKNFILSFLAGATPVSLFAMLVASFTGQNTFCRVFAIILTICYTVSYALQIKD